MAKKSTITTFAIISTSARGICCYLAAAAMLVFARVFFWRDSEFISTGGFFLVIVIFYFGYFIAHVQSRLLYLPNAFIMPGYLRIHRNVVFIYSCIVSLLATAVLATVPLGTDAILILPTVFFGVMLIMAIYTVASVTVAGIGVLLILILIALSYHDTIAQLGLVWVFYIVVLSSNVLWGALWLIMGSEWCAGAFRRRHFRSEYFWKSICSWSIFWAALPAWAERLHGWVYRHLPGTTWPVVWSQVYMGFANAVVWRKILIPIWLVAVVLASRTGSTAFLWLMGFACIFAAAYTLPMWSVFFIPAGRPERFNSSLSFAVVLAVLAFIGMYGAAGISMILRAYGFFGVRFYVQRVEGFYAVLCIVPLAFACQSLFMTRSHILRLVGVFLWVLPALAVWMWPGFVAGLVAVDLIWRISAVIASWAVFIYCLHLTLKIADLVYGREKPHQQLLF